MNSAFLEGSMINALIDLLKIPGADEDSDDEKPKSGVARLNPGDIGGKAEEASDKSKAASKITTIKKDTKDIWDVDEVTTGAEYDDIHDPRQQPEYDIVYRQSVTPEDMFLQLGNKTTMTSSCEDMIVKIKLPETTVAQIELDIKETFLDCRTPKYKLGLFLPHPVDAKNGKAQWEPRSETLSVTLRLNRLLDFVNF